MKSYDYHPYVKYGDKYLVHMNKLNYPTIKEIEIIRIKAFDGRNIFSHNKCVVIEIEEKCTSPIYEEIGFSIAKFCEKLIFIIFRLLNIKKEFSKVIKISGNKQLIIFSYDYKETTLKVASLALDIINKLLTNKNIIVDNEINALKSSLYREMPGISTKAICEEARKLNIPVLKLGETGMYQLGLGRFSKIIDATIYEDTSALGVDISCHKILTKDILKLHMLPVAKGYLVKNPIDLLSRAKEIGYPVVLKPLRGNQGNGVIINLKNQEDLLKAYYSLNESYENIIIEQYIKGKDYRVCVVDGKVVAASLRLPPFVIGDGRKTIEQLIQELNMDPRRGEGHEKALSKVTIDDILINCIKEKGYNLNSTLPYGEKLFLRKNANLSTGGISIDCTDEICSENIEICERASKAISLNICGIDLCCEDIRKPIKNNGAIIEVNAAPGIRMHHFPYEGKSRNVAKAIVESMFKSNPKTIPIISVTGTNGKTTVSRLITHVLSQEGYKVGLTTTSGIYIDGKCIEKGDTTGPKSALAVLHNKDIDAAVLETARGGIIRDGIGYDLAQVGIITNITSDHLGVDGVKSIKELAFIKALVGEAIKKDGYAVLNADDEMSMNILNRIKSKKILFSMDKNNHHLRNNLELGGWSLYCECQWMIAEKSNAKITITSIKDVAISYGGLLAYNIENALAAASALIALGIEPSSIARGLSTFRNDDSFNPGRFNLYKVNNRTIILDYGHNIGAYKAVIKGVKAIDHNRLIGIIGVPGDRMNSDILSIGKFSGNNFDYLYIKEDINKRGRNEGEVANLLLKGAYESSISKDNIKVILDERIALLTALDNSKPGDIIIIFFENYEALIDIIKNSLHID